MDKKSIAVMEKLRSYKGIDISVGELLDSSKEVTAFTAKSSLWNEKLLRESENISRLNRLVE